MLTAIMGISTTIIENKTINNKEKVIQRMIEIWTSVFVLTLCLLCTRSSVYYLVDFERND